MSIDITVNETIESVDITANLNVIEVNITRQSGGGGAVDSVNGQTGIVVLDATDVGAYTTSEVDTLLLDKFDNPTGDNTQYLDGTGTPVTFPTIPSVSNLVPYTGATQNVDLGEFEIKAGQIELDQTPTGTAGVAVTRWNDSLGSTETTLKGGNVVLKNGVDLVARVVNKVTPNTTLTKAAYQAVRVSGAQGQRLAVAFAQANNDNNSADTIGIVCETIATNQEGFILTVGQLEGINTTGALQGETWNDGDVLYLSPTTAGAITNVKPTGATGHIVVIGYVEYSHVNNGKIYVKVMNGWELDELHNVNILSPANNQILAYTSASSLWENKSISTALGFTPEDVANKQTDLTASATKYPTINAVNTGLALKIDKSSWVDISSTSTIVGWSSFTTKYIAYKLVDNLLYVKGTLSGTSNATNATFTIPFTSVNTQINIGLSTIVNGGAAQSATGLLTCAANSSLVTILRNYTGTAFSATGTKGCEFNIIIEL